MDKTFNLAIVRTRGERTETYLKAGHVCWWQTVISKLGHRQRTPGASWLLARLVPVGRLWVQRKIIPDLR